MVSAHHGSATVDDIVCCQMRRSQRHASYLRTTRARTTVPLRLRRGTTECSHSQRIRCVLPGTLYHHQRVWPSGWVSVFINREPGRHGGPHFVTRVKRRDQTLPSLHAGDCQEAPNCPSTSAPLQVRRAASSLNVSGRKSTVADIQSSVKWAMCSLSARTSFAKVTTISRRC